MESVLVDTGVWYSIFDEKDERYDKGIANAKLLDMLQVVIPWPSMYETLRTRFVKNTFALGRFERFLQSSRIVFLDDQPYRDEAIQLSFDSSLRRRRPLSMIDCLIRILVVDENTRFHYLATFNHRDFIDVCATRGIEII